MKRIFLVIICSFSALALLGDTVKKPLDHILKPQFMEVNGERLYVTEQAVVHVFSLDDGKPLHSFGKMGEGPQEFKMFPGTSLHLDFKNGAPVVFSIGKVSFFSRDGRMVSEKKNTRMLNRVYFVGDSFAAIGFNQDNQKVTITVDICDNNLVKKKELYSYEVTKGNRVKLLEKTFSFRTENNRIYIAQGTDFTINVMDVEGQNLGRAHQDYQREKLTRENKDKIFRWYRTNPLTRPYADQIINSLTLPSHFPAIRDFRVSEGILYVQTYRQSEGKTEFYVIDAKNEKQMKLKKKAKLKIYRDNPIEEMQFFTIKNGILYQLVENDDGWSLETGKI